MNYDFHVNRCSDNLTVLQIKWLFKRAGYHIDLHRFMAVDDIGCFHTHPAPAIRIVLAGGYTEEVYPYGVLRQWNPGDIGYIRPEFCHRIDALNADTSYSLWLRGRVCADIWLHGLGWPAEKRGRISSLVKEPR